MLSSREALSVGMCPHWRSKSANRVQAVSEIAIIKFLQIFTGELHTFNAAEPMGGTSDLQLPTMIFLFWLLYKQSDPLRALDFQWKFKKVRPAEREELASKARGTSQRSTRN